MRNMVIYTQKTTSYSWKIKHRCACSLLSAGDRSNIILRVPRLNHKKQDKFKDNIIKQQFG